MRPCAKRSSAIWPKARSLAASALTLASTLNTQTLAALAMARAGDTVRARELADGLEKANPLNTRINGYWLPSIRATIEINHQNPRKAIEILQAAARYKLGVANPQTQVGGMLYPIYVRAQAYTLAAPGSAAAAEYQKYLDHRTICRQFPSRPTVPSGSRSRLRRHGRLREGEGSLSGVLDTVEIRRPRHSPVPRGQSGV